MNQKYTDEEVSKVVERIHSRIVYPQHIQKEKWSVLSKVKFVFLLVLMVSWVYFFAVVFTLLFVKSAHVLGFVAITIVIYLLQRDLFKKVV